MKIRVRYILLGLGILFLGNIFAKNVLSSTPPLSEKDQTALFVKEVIKKHYPNWCPNDFVAHGIATRGIDLQEAKPELKATLIREAANKARKNYMKHYKKLHPGADKVQLGKIRSDLVAYPFASNDLAEARVYCFRQCGR